MGQSPHPTHDVNATRNSFDADGPLTMRIFDTHLDVATLHDADLENLAYFGTSAGIAVPSRAQRFPDAASLASSLEQTVDADLARARAWRLRLRAAVGVHTDVRPHRAFSGIWETLERLVALPDVCAVGVLGRDGLATGDSWLQEQLDLARRAGVPAIVDVRGSQPHEDVIATLELARDVGLRTSALLLLGVDYTNARPVVESGALAGLALGASHASPADAARMVARFGSGMLGRWVVANASAAAGSEVLASARFARALQRQGLATNDIDRVLWGNAVDGFGFTVDAAQTGWRP